MTTFLYRLGTFAFRRHRLVAAGWLVAVVLAVGGSLLADGEPTDGLDVPGTEAQRAGERLESEFPDAAAGGASARVVVAVAGPGTLTDPERQAAVDDLTERLRAGAQVSAVVPISAQSLSADRRTGVVEVAFDAPANELTAQAREDLAASVESGRGAGLVVETGGDAVDAAPELGSAEAVGLAVAGVVLVVTFGSLVAAGLSLVTALLGVTLGFAGIGLAAAVVDVPSSVSMLALMLGLAVGIDYALFITSRYRAELAAGHQPEQAAGRTVATAGAAVVFAGSTVIIALVGLVVVGIPFLTAMGLGAAAVVAVAVLIALTLVPATFGLLGTRLRQGRSRRTGAGRVTLGRRWVHLALRRPALTVAATVTVLLVVALPALDMRLGLSDDGTAPEDSSPRRAFELVTTAFGPGAAGRLTVVVDPVDSASVRAAVARLDDVASVSPVRTSDSGRTAVFSVTPTGGPNDPSTVALLATIREDVGATAQGDVLVTGRTAVNIDASETISAALPVYLGSIIGLASVLLVIVFRSVLVPLKATLGFLLTIGATFGVMVAVFQWGWGAELLEVPAEGPIISLMPIFIIGIGFGLAMDYEVFLVTGMREHHVAGATPTEAVVEGFSTGARVVTAAAIIMVSIFGGFAAAPDLSIKMPGVGLATAILVDAFLVRMTLVPAVMSLLGRTAWWLPGRLDALLPRVDLDAGAPDASGAVTTRSVLAHAGPGAGTPGRPAGSGDQGVAS